MSSSILTRFMMPYHKFLNKRTKFVGYYQTIGWTMPQKMYSFYCEIHQLTVVNYPQGYNEKLICPLCLHSNS